MSHLQKCLECEDTLTEGAFCEPCREIVLKGLRKNKTPAKPEPKEQPCKNCSRINDVGIKSCWFCCVENPTSN